MPSQKQGSLAQLLETRAAASKSTLSRNDEKVLAFLRGHIDEIGVHTTESVSQGAGVSAAAIVRFAARLGFSGFRELREVARAEVIAARLDGEAAVNAKNDVGGLVRRKADTDTNNLAVQVALVSDETMVRVASILDSARRVWVIGNRETYGIAVYLQRLLHDVRDDVHLVEPGFADPMRGLAPDDAVMACTFRPYARYTTDLLPHVRESGAQLIVLCDSTANRFLAESDTVLVAPIESPTVFLSLVPAVFLMETVAGYLARTNPERTHQALEATADLSRKLDLTREGLAQRNNMRHDS